MEVEVEEDGEDDDDEDEEKEAKAALRYDAVEKVLGFVRRLDRCCSVVALVWLGFCLLLLDMFMYSVVCLVCSFWCVICLGASLLFAGQENAANGKPSLVFVH